MPPRAILWFAIAFSGTLALGRTFERERYGDTLRALLLAPARARPCMSASWSVSSRCSLRPRPSSCRSSRCCFRRGLGDHLLLISALLLFGTVGFATVGTLFAAMLSARQEPGRALADPVVSGHNPGDDRGVRGDRRPPAVEPQLDMARLWVMMLLWPSTWCL
jgi:hypothetical protein